MGGTPVRHNGFRLASIYRTERKQRHNQVEKIRDVQKLADHLRILTFSLELISTF